MDDFEKEFIVEAIEEIQDNLTSLNDLIYELEANNTVEDICNHIFRLVHNIKGNAKAAGFNDISAVVHELETKLLPYREGKGEFSELDIKILSSFYTCVFEVLDQLKVDLSYEFNFSKLIEEIQRFGTAEVQAVNMIDPQEEEIRNPVSEENDSDKLAFLLVDDEKDIIETLSDILEMNFNCKIDSALNGEDALKHCQNKKYDCIITDFNMPILNGLDFLQETRSGNGKNKDTAVIFSSGYKPDLIPDKRVWENVFILDKPFGAKKLIFLMRCFLKLKQAA